MIEPDILANAGNINTTPFVVPWPTAAVLRHMVEADGPGDTALPSWQAIALLTGGV